MTGAIVRLFIVIVLSIPIALHIVLDKEDPEKYESVEKPNKEETEVINNAQERYLMSYEYPTDVEVEWLFQTIPGCSLEGKEYYRVKGSELVSSQEDYEVIGAVLSCEDIEGAMNDLFNRNLLNEYLSVDFEESRLSIGIRTSEVPVW